MNNLQALNDLYEVSLSPQITLTNFTNTLTITLPPKISREVSNLIRSYCDVTFRKELQRFQNEHNNTINHPE